MVKKPSNIEFILAMPANALRAGLTYGRTAVAQSVEVFLPSQSAGEFVKQLERERRLNDANVGVKAIETGRKLDVPELEYIGEALVTKALIRAKTSPSTPPQVAEQVAETVEQIGVDPEWVPLLGDDDATQAKGILQSYDKVKHLFPNR